MFPGEYSTAGREYSCIGPARAPACETEAHLYPLPAYRLRLKHTTRSRSRA